MWGLNPLCVAYETTKIPYLPLAMLWDMMDSNHSLADLIYSQAPVSEQVSYPKNNTKENNVTVLFVL